jgi:hypothetical protein
VDPALSTWATGVLRWIGSLPLLPLTVIALLLALAPFVPEPHLVEKLRMLAAGTLSRPIDILDLLFHASGLVLLTIRLLHRR